MNTMIGTSPTTGLIAVSVRLTAGQPDFFAYIHQIVDNFFGA